MEKMKSTVIALMFLTLSFNLLAQIDSIGLSVERIEKSLEYQSGTISFPSCNAKLNVPKGFRFLNSEQAKYVMSDLWGNPVDSTLLGLLVPENRGVLESNSWVFTLCFDKIGYVKDDDAEDIDYTEMLEQIQKETKEGNPERVKLGYSTVEIIGWASSPYYDKDKKVLHWAKEAKFGTDTVNTLNYNLRILGKDGVFMLNAVSSMQGFKEVKSTIDDVLASITFDKGSSYFDFDPKIDNVAAWSIGGLVAGKVLAKVGFFAIIAKFAKVIIFALMGFGAAFWRFITGKKDKKKDDVSEGNIIENE